MLSFLRRTLDSHLRAALVGSAVSLVTKLGTAGIGFGVTVIIARTFGAGGSGTWVLATTLLTICGYISLCGLDYSTTRAIAIYRAADRWAAIRAWTLTGLLIIGLAGSLLTALVWAFAPQLAGVFSEGPGFVAVTKLLCFAILPYSLLRLLGGLLRGMRRFALAEVLEGIFVPVTLGLWGLTLGLKSLQQVSELYVTATIVGAVFGLSMWFLLLGRRGVPSDPLLPREALTRSLPLAGTVLTLLAGPWIMTLFLAKFATPADVGIYRVSFQFYLLLGFLLAATETGMSPQIAALHSQGKLRELSQSTKQMTLLLIVAGGVPALILAIFAPQFLSILGPEFPRGATAMRILIVGQMVNLATGPVGSFMIMTGHERISFRNAIVGTSLVFVLSLVLIPLWGINGAAVAGAAGTTYRNLAMTVILWRMQGLFLPLGIVRGGVPTPAPEAPPDAVAVAVQALAMPAETPLDVLTEEAQPSPPRPPLAPRAAKPAKSG